MRENKPEGSKIIEGLPAGKEGNKGFENNRKTHLTTRNLSDILTMNLLSTNMETKAK
ncbi:hypothetical protein K8T06_14695 [bacterium]|nr:hypothetical protein [bacterium]